MTVDPMLLPSEITILVGCVLLGLGLFINILAHIRWGRANQRTFVTGQDIVNEMVWWLVNGGMLILSVGIFWLVERIVRLPGR